MSIKYKIALLFSLLVTILFTIVSLSIYYFTAKERKDTFRTRLKNRALSTATVYAEIKDSNFYLLQKMDSAAVASLYNKSVSIVNKNQAHEYMYSDTTGDSLFLTKNIIAEARNNGEYFFPYKNKKAIAIYYNVNSSDFVVAVSASDIDGREFLAQLKKILIGALFVSAALSFLGGLLFAKKLISPMARITEEVTLITSKNLSQRIKISNTRDELSILAQTFNDLLDRLQDSFAIQRRFISNASHELSTPLTSVSSQVEVALQKDRAIGEYKDVLQSIHEDIVELQQLTHSLLDIAKTGSQGSIDLKEVRLDDLLFKVLTDVQKQNEGFRVLLDFEVFQEDEKLLTVFGNTNLLYIALKNIIENGCKYSDNNQSTVVTAFYDKEAVIKVINKGDVITESDIQNIFQPFFRANNVQNKPGFGLGLTLTRRILALHKGSVSVVSDIEKGTIFTIVLPNINSFT
ncbi:MAG: HAMP domain-containing histidine kinase [Bacteroidetes bacterium]|nr:HAMP domain-containing histidine kinase [Bacteroidota bacterium]